MSSSSSPETPNNVPVPPTTKPTKQRIIDAVSNLQFAWFAGHVLTLSASALYFLSYRAGKGIVHRTSYKLIYLGILESFGIILQQSIKSNVLKVNDTRALLADDNVQYFLVASALLLILPVISLSLFPFILFSFFHSLTYIRSTLLPLFNLKNSSQISNRLGSFIKNYNDISMYYAANFEIATFGYILLRALVWSKGYWLALVFYGVFIKLRYEKSIFTRTCFKKLEVRFDGLFSHSAVSPAVKKYWIDLKSAIKKYTNQFKLIGGPAATPAKAE